MKLMGRLDRLAHRRALKYWTQVGRDAGALDPETLGQLGDTARGLRGALDQVIAAAERSRGPASGQLAPAAADDWSWRPAAWEAAQPGAMLVAPETGTPLGTTLKLFHDCTDPTFSARQELSPPRPPKIALECFQFDGSFLSLVMDLPDHGLTDLKRHHIIEVRMCARRERPIEMLARLNVRHGPNTEQIVHEMAPIPETEDTWGLAFDMAYAGIDQARISGAWIDLIFDSPAMNRIVIQDLLVTRRVRSEV